MQGVMPQNLLSPQDPLLLLILLHILMNNVQTPEAFTAHVKTPKTLNLPPKLKSVRGVHI